MLGFALGRGFLFRPPARARFGIDDDVTNGDAATGRACTYVAVVELRRYRDAGVVGMLATGVSSKVRATMGERSSPVSFGFLFRSFWIRWCDCRERCIVPLELIRRLARRR